MKLLAVIFLAVLLTSKTRAKNFKDFLLQAVDDVAHKAVGDKLENVIESFKEIFKNGNETWGIPVLDPYKSDAQNISFASDKIKGEISIDSVDVYGLSNYEVKKTDFKMVGLKMSITLQWSKIRGDINAFNLSGKLFNLIDIYGNGDAEFTLNDIKFSKNLTFGINTKNKIVFIKSMESEVSLRSCEFYSEGIFNDKDISQVISAVFSDETPRFIEIYQEKLTKKINEVIMPKVNDILREMNLKDLMKIIM